MAKNKKALQDKPVELQFDKEGITVILRGMPPLVPQRIANSVQMPDPPTYEVEAADGTIEVWEHDETTLRTDEEKEAWEEYQTERQEAETLVTERLLKAILLESVDIKVENGALDRWKKRQLLMGLDVPEDEDELLLYFKESEVFKTMDDIQNIMDQVLELTGVSRKEIDAMKDSFPGDVESKSPAESGNEAPEPEDQEG